MKNGNYETDLQRTEALYRCAHLAAVLSLCMGALFVICGAGASLLCKVVCLVITVFIAWLCWSVCERVLKPLARLKRTLYAAESEDEQSLQDEDVDALTENTGLLQGLLWMIMSKTQTGFKAKALDAEVALYALQSEINPHFLYNALEVIRNCAIKRGVEEISEISLALARIFRYSISRPGEVATVEDEINNVRNYIKIQQYRFPDRFEIVYDVDESDASIMNCKLPVLTLQPIVENALNHGLEAKTGGGKITLRVLATDRRMAIIITDTGGGISAEKLEALRSNLNSGFVLNNNLSERRHLDKKSGISLNNVNNRLKIYFGDAYGLTVTSVEGKFTTVEIVVPKVLAL